MTRENDGEVLREAVANARALKRAMRYQAGVGDPQWAAQCALAEMHVSHGRSGLTDEEWTAGIPAQLRFIDSVEQDTGTFHGCLMKRGFGPLDSEPDQRAEPGRPHYDGDVMLPNYERVRVLVFRGGAVRLYPKDDYVPTTDELTTIVAGLQHGWHSPLVHDPIDRHGHTEKRGEKP
jgi:hypothetical protein